jgi:hypothetical protein
MKVSLSSSQVLLPGGMRPAVVIIEGERIVAIEDRPVAGAVELGDAAIRPLTLRLRQLRARHSRLR